MVFGLAGIPPMVGFIGKLAVLQAAVDAGLVWLAVLGVIASVIGAFYYLRIVYFMYFGEETEGLDGSMTSVQWVAMVAAAGVMILGLFNFFGFATGIEAMAMAAAETLVE